MLRRRLVCLAVTSLLVLLACGRSLAGPTAMVFTMPTGVDPPPKFLDHLPVPTSSSELATGLNLYGRALTVSSTLTCNLVFEDITCIQIKFTSGSGVKVKSVVEKGMPYVPWAVTTSRNGTQWTITLTAQPGSAPLSSWDVDGLGNGFFALLTAKQGSGAPADISNVTITPSAWSPNANQRKSNDVVDTFAPIISGAVDLPQLWVPNGKTVDVVVSGSVTDDPTETPSIFISGVDPCSVQATLSYTDGGAATDLGSVPVAVTLHPDGTVTFELTAGVTSARTGGSAGGRIYTFRITANDFFGNAAVPLEITVTVLHDQGS